MTQEKTLLGKVIWATADKGKSPPEAFFIQARQDWEACSSDCLRLSFILEGLLKNGYFILRVCDLYNTDEDTANPTERHQ